LFGQDSFSTVVSKIKSAPFAKNEVVLPVIAIKEFGLSSRLGKYV
jgi:hypothetical protein